MKIEKRRKKNQHRLYNCIYICVYVDDIRRNNFDVIKDGNFFEQNLNANEILDESNKLKTLLLSLFISYFRVYFGYRDIEKSMLDQCPNIFITLHV